MPRAQFCHLWVPNIYIGNDCYRILASSFRSPSSTFYFYFIALFRYISLLNALSLFNFAHPNFFIIILFMQSLYQAETTGETKSPSYLPFTFLLL